MVNKKGISVIVGYVLLISITIALSVFVYNWLKFYISEDEIDECSDNVNMIINGYECYKRVSGLGGTDSRSGNLTVKFKNKGLFNIDGYILRVHDKEGAKFGIHVLNKTGTSLAPGEEIIDVYLFEENLVGENADQELRTVTIIEVQPFILGEDGQISCQSYTSQKTTCK